MTNLKYKNAGERLRVLRKLSKLSIFKVAKAIHVSGNYISLLERGINSPSNAVLLNLAEFYKIEPSELFKLYDRVVPPNDEQLSAIPSLKKIMTEISIDDSLTIDEKDEFAKRIYEIVNDLIINKGEK